MKQIRSKQDLAIHGASPAFDSPVHVGRPNIGDREDFLRRVTDIVDRHWLTNNGPVVQEFERRIADFLGVKHCVAMCNGTIALEIAIRALHLEGEVIVPSWTFIATAHALHWQEITPVFADIDPHTHNLDPHAVRRMITPRTTGIIGVHLWGRAAPVEELQEIADEHGLQLLFDAAHAFGSTHRGRRIGSFGRCEVFSFHATKAFNTMEGGAVTTNDDELAEAIRLMRNFGFVHYDKVIHPGTNGKMVEVCAAMGLSNLTTLDTTIEVNRLHFREYEKAFSDIRDLRLVQYNDDNTHHYVVAEIEGGAHVRDAIVTALHAENILARKYFWPGCHLMKPYRDLFPHAGLLLPNTNAVSERVVILPTGTGLPAGTVDAVASVCREVLASA